MAAPLLLDLVLETATNPGTGSFVLNGAVQDRRSFAAAAPGGGQVFYFADDGTQAEWGVGVLAVGTPNTLSRQTVTGTTQNTVQALNFTGTVRVYSWVPASYTPVLDGNGSLALRGDLSARAVSANGNSKSGSLYYSASLGTVITGYLINNSGVPSTQGQTYRADLWMEVNPGVSTYAVLRAWTWQGERRWQLTETGDVVSDLRGSVAWKTDLAAYQPAGDYASSGSVSDLTRVVGQKIDGTASGGNLAVYNLQLVNAPTSDNAAAYFQAAVSWGTLILPTSGRTSQMIVDYAQPKGNYQPAGDYALVTDLPMDRSEKIVRMTAYNVTSLTRVNFSSGFSDTPQVIAQNRNGSDMNCKATSADKGGFTLWINGGGTTDIDVIAIGPK